MNRWLTILITLLISAIVVGCGSEPPVSMEQAYDDFIDAIRQVESPAEKTALCEGFLTRFPDSEHTGSLAEAVAYYRGEALEDPTGAVAVLDTLLDAVDDPDTRFQVRMARFPLAQKIGHAADLEAIVTELQAHRPLTFSEHLEVGDVAANHEFWALAEKHAAAASTVATVDAYRADYPDTELGEDEIAAKAEKRAVMAAANRGWALAHLDRAPEAIEVFETASPLSTSNYLGVPSTDLFAFWGRTALIQGDAEKAMDLLGSTAVLGDNDEAFDAYREAYIAVHGDEAGFEEHLWSARQSLAKVVDNFELPDYEGTIQNLADTRGKVVFLSFWFPT